MQKTLLGISYTQKQTYIQPTQLRINRRLVVSLNLLLSNNRLMAAFQLRQNNPSRQDAQHSEAKVDADRHKVVRVALALHGPSNSLTQRLHTAQDTSVVRQVAQISRVLADDPVQKLLERLAAKLPEENQRIRGPKAALEPVEHGLGLGIVELLLQDGGPDPGADEDGDDADEGNLGALLDVDALVVEQSGDDEGAEDAGEVGEEGAERAAAHGEVGGEPGAHEAVVEVAYEEGRQQEQDAAADEELADGFELVGPAGCALSDQRGAVLAPYFVRGGEHQSDGKTEAHDDDEDYVGGGGDGAGGLALRVETKVDGSSHDGTGRFGRLPDGQVERTVVGRWVANDDSSFSGPEETGADTAEGAAKEHEPGVCADVVGVQASTIERVSDCTKRKSIVQANAVVDGTGEYTDNSEEPVNQGIGGGHGVGLSSTTSAQAAEGIPHARRGEGDTACYDDLEGDRTEEGLVRANRRSI